MEKPTEGQTAMIDTNGMPWSDSPFPGIQMKLLYEDHATGASTIMFKFEPGAKTPVHEHTGLEQTFVIQGSLIDHDGQIKAGGYAVRHAGSVHQAYAGPEGSLHIAVFGAKNRMLLDKVSFP